LTLLSGKVFFAAVYNPSTGAFTPKGNTPLCALCYHASSLLRNGKVLISGGGEVELGSGPANSELYDPATGTFADTGNLTTGRLLHTATLLADGKVLIAGGNTESSYQAQSTATAELYDAATGTSADTGTMVSGRQGHSATLLTNGTVLVAGGQFSCCYASGVPPRILSSAEIYYPEQQYTPRLSLDSEEYCVATTWQLNVSKAAPDTSIRLLGISNGQSRKIADWRKTERRRPLSAMCEVRHRFPARGKAR
jgi:hypothetical protein